MELITPLSISCSHDVQTFLRLIWNETEIHANANRSGGQKKQLAQRLINFSPSYKGHIIIEYSRAYLG